MVSFTSVVYDEVPGTVSLGAGCKWDEIYASLQPYNVTVAGGRPVSVGIFISGSFRGSDFFQVLALFLEADTAGLRTNTA